MATHPAWGPAASSGRDGPQPIARSTTAATIGGCRQTLASQAYLVAWYAERALDPAALEEDRARSAFWIEDIAANAFTLARIDAWLAAVSGA
jgi:hypothetical protein